MHVFWSVTFAIFCGFFGFLIVAKIAGIFDKPHGPPAPPVNPPPYQYEPSRAEIVQAYCHMRGFVPEWRSDHGMFALRKPGMAPLHGFAIYVTPWTNLAGWLNAMDAYECGNRLRPELEPDTLSVQNIDPSNGAGSQV